MCFRGRARLVPEQPRAARSLSSRDSGRHIYRSAGTQQARSDTGIPLKPPQRPRLWRDLAQTFADDAPDRPVSAPPHMPRLLHTFSVIFFSKRVFGLPATRHSLPREQSSRDSGRHVCRSAGTQQARRDTGMPLKKPPQRPRLWRDLAQTFTDDASWSGASDACSLVRIQRVFRGAEAWVKISKWRQIRTCETIALKLGQNTRLPDRRRCPLTCRGYCKLFP